MAEDSDAAEAAASKLSALGKLKDETIPRICKIVCAGVGVVYPIAYFAVRDVGALAEVLTVSLICAALYIIIDLLHAFLRRSGTQAQEATLAAGIALLASKVDGLADGLGNFGDVRFAAYENEQVYEATVRLVARAERRIWVVYSSEQPPNLRDRAEVHFEACRAWAMSSEKHRFRRLILHGDVCSMEDFCADELRAVTAAGTCHSYQVKVLGELHHSPAMLNVGLYDDAVFVTYREGDDRIFGFSLYSKHLADHFTRYFERLWSLPSATPIQHVATTATPGT